MGQWLNQLMTGVKEAAAKIGMMKPMQVTVPAALVPITVKVPLKSDQYYQAIHPKKFIFLHYTAGGTAAGAFGQWASDPQRIATPYVIDRDGTIYETYDPKYWAYHLGVKGMTSMEKASIGIELVAYGQLLKKGTKYMTYTNKALPIEEVSNVKWRGYDYYHEFTQEQIDALRELIPYLLERFKIELQPVMDRKNFYDLRDPKTLPGGVWSHTTVRKDKLDIFPQPEIVNLVAGL